MRECIIIGAGASGMMAAFTAARKGSRVKVLERYSKVGRKLLATGNGRCNLSNSSLSIKNFHGENSAFVETLLKRFDFLACRELFREIGVEIVEGPKGKFYPLSLHAKSVVEALYHSCIYAGVEFHMETLVDNIIYENSTFSILSKEKEFKAKKLLIATGGMAAPSLGGTEDGLSFAKALGHNIIPTFATLVQLRTFDKNIHLAAGVKIVCALSVKIDNALVQSIEGDLLFTKYGLSGSAILDVSRNVTNALHQNKKVEIVLDLFPKMSKDALSNLFALRLEKVGHLPISVWLGGVLNPNLIPSILKIMKWESEDKITKEKKALRQLAHHLKNWSVHIDGDRGFKGAEVMAGGVDVSEIDEKTMASKLCKGLYFSGEVIDIDGDCGGYNLHFAWMSGLVAGESMAD